MADEDLELQIRATLETDEVKKGAEDIEESIKKVGKTNENVHEKIRTETEKTGTIWTKVFNLSNVVSLAKNGADMIISTIQRIGATVMNFRDAADDSQDTVDALNLQLKNMGMYTDETSQKIQDFAEELQATTNFSNEDILGADTLLLTFRNISEDILPEATERLLDMSSVMGQDLKSSSIQLGKALSDPVDGITALSRVGITFTEQQKESIKKFVEQNDIMSAQKIILDELSTEFGGHAKLQVDAVEQSKNAWQTFKEVLGDRLQPTVDGLFTGFSKLIGVMTEVFKQTEVEKVTEDISAQQVEVQMLQNEFETLATKTNRTKEEQGKLEKVISELQKIYPDFLKNVDAQKIGYDDMTTALSGLNKQMERKFVYMAAEAEISDKMKEYAKYQKKVVENEDKLAEAIAKRQLKEKELLGMTTEEAKKTGKMGEFSEKKGKLLTGDLFQLGREYENENTWKKYLERDKTAAKKYLGEVEKIKEDYNDVLKEFGSAEEIVTGNGVTGNGTGDDTKTKYSLDTSQTLAQKKQKINAKADEELILADEFQKKIIEINRKRDLSIAEAEFKLADDIQKMKDELEKDNSKANRNRLQKILEDRTKATQDTISKLNQTAIKDTEEVNLLKNADVNSSKNADEKIKQKNYKEPEGIYDLYNPQAKKLPGISPDILRAEKRKEQEVWEEHYSMLEKLEEGRLTYTEIHNSKLDESEKKRFEQMKASNSMQQALAEDKKKFQNMLGNTGTELADKLISGEIKSGKQMKALMKENLKAYLIDSGQRHAHKALEEGAFAIASLAAHKYDDAALHGQAAALHVGVAAAAGVAANGIKTSTGSGGYNNHNREAPGSAVSETKTKELVINTDNQQVVRMLLPELAQALDDGYSISKR